MTPEVMSRLMEIQLGYSVVFLCLTIGFFSLFISSHRPAGAGYWTLSFFFNSLGFLFWSGTVPIPTWLFFLLGEVLHITGFVLLTLGAFRFAGQTFKTWHKVYFGIWVAIWVLGLLWYPTHNSEASVLVKMLRALLFIPAGAVLIFGDRREKTMGVPMAGGGLMLWGVYIVVFTLIPLKPYTVYLGFLVGFHLIAAIGMVTMMMDRIRIRAEESEKHVAQLEGLLPICSYCKNIRDEDNHWHRLEAYIEDRSQAEFTHGICPDCFAKFRPDK